MEKFGKFIGKSVWEPCLIAIQTFKHADKYIFS